MVDSRDKHYSQASDGGIHAPPRNSRNLHIPLVLIEAYLKINMAATDQKAHKWGTSIYACLPTFYLKTPTKIVGYEKISS
jgi:hypothetical protein